MRLKNLQVILFVFLKKFDKPYMWKKKFHQNQLTRILFTNRMFTNFLMNATDPYLNIKDL